MSKTLLKYIPESSLPLIRKWFKDFDFHLRISKSRKSKFGDFRPAFQDKPNRISVNGDLNQYHFLITLTHEVAHAATWIKYKTSVSPHGQEWKNTYSTLLKEMMQVVSFPDDILMALKDHLKRPKASSCSDPYLYKMLKKHDPDIGLVFLEELGEGEEFVLHEKRLFTKGNRRRTRYECIEKGSRKVYLISGHAEVRRRIEN